MDIENFKLFFDDITDYNMIIVSDSDKNYFSNPLNISIQNVYRMSDQYEVNHELMECFIYDEYYCSNMDSYYFGFDECSVDFFNSFYDELMEFMLKYDVNPTHFKFIQLDGCNLTEDMLEKLSKISDISFTLDNYS